MGPLVSIIVPIYNAEKYLNRCVNSLLNQTYGNLEILLVDDGSLDKSSRICDTYEKQDSRVKAIHKENGGVSLARNTGLEKSTGDFIVFLDSDDYAEEDLIQTALSSISQAEVIVWSYFVDFIDSEEFRYRYKVVKLPDGNYITDKINTLELSEDFVGSLGYVWNKMYKADFIRRNSYKFDVNVSLFEDLVFNAEVLAAADAVVFINVPLTHYNQRQETTLGTKFHKDYFSLKLMSLNSIYSLLKSWRFKDGDIVRLTALLSYGMLKSTARVVSKTTDMISADKIRYLNKVMASQVASETFRNYKSKLAKDRLILNIMRTRNGALIFLFYKFVSFPKSIFGVNPFKEASVELIKALKRMIPESVKGSIKAAFQSSRDEELEKLIGKRKIIVTLAGFYQNMGDMALTFAQNQFLKDNFPGYEVVLFPSTDTYSRIKALKKFCSDDDIITTIGGGNMDDLYVSLENVRRFIVKSFPRNRIISFPQTISFSNTPYGIKRKNMTIKTYSKHKDLTIFARERKSLEIMREAFPNNQVYYCPDIVLYLSRVEPQCDRDGVIYCVRNDLEAYLTEEQRGTLKKMISDNFTTVTYTDTVNVTLEECSPNNYERTLENFWLLLRKSKIVITDRLHCMIFCAITKTPCVVLSNNNHKIRGTYHEWLKELEYIQFIEEFDGSEIVNCMKQLETIDLSKCNELDLEDKYESLRRALFR